MGSGSENDKQVEHRGIFQGSKTILHGTIMANTRLCFQNPKPMGFG